MCRQSQLLGLILISFGAGALIGCWLASDFLASCIGIGAAALGVLVLNKK